MVIEEKRFLIVLKKKFNDLTDDLNVCNADTASVIDDAAKERLRLNSELEALKLSTTKRN